MNLDRQEACRVHIRRLTSEETSRSHRRDSAWPPRWNRPPARAASMSPTCRATSCRRREVRDLPEPPKQMWRLIGPGVVGAGVGLASGEFILWPYITSQVGLIFLWGALLGVVDPVVLEHGDRALHARHRRDGADRLQPLLEVLGPGVRRDGVPPEPVARLGDELGHDADLPVRREPEGHRHRHARGHRRGAHAGAGRLRRARAADLPQGGGDRPVRDRRRLRGRSTGAPGSRCPTRRPASATSRPSSGWRW